MARLRSCVVYVIGHVSSNVERGTFRAALRDTSSHSHCDVVILEDAFDQYILVSCNDAPNKVRFFDFSFNLIQYFFPVDAIKRFDRIA